MYHEQGIEKIGRKDIIWNYAATFIQIGTGLILLPFILKMMPAETIGIWTIFTTIASLIALLDFGFNPSFTRNISYIFSGAKSLKREGISEISLDGRIDYNLLKGTIAAMRWFYSRMAIIVLLILLFLGSWYLYSVLQTYHGDKADAYIAWILLVFINSYNIYTLYYDSLLQGKGLIKSSKQISIIGNCIYLLVAVILILVGYGLIAIVSAQLISIVIKRILSYKTFYTQNLKNYLFKAENIDKKQIISAIYPNAMKLGLTQLGGFCVNQSAVFIGAIYLTLSEVANYGVTFQVLGILTGLAGVYYQSYVPKIAQCRTENNMVLLKHLYIKSNIIQLLILVAGGLVFAFLGNIVLSVLGSETKFLSISMILVSVLILTLEKNHALAAGFLLAKNEVPFFKASLWSGGATILLLWFFLGPLKWGLWGMIIAQGIAQAAYQNWKWPLVLMKEIKNK